VQERRNTLPASNGKGGGWIPDKAFKKLRTEHNTWWWSQNGLQDPRLRLPRWAMDQNTKRRADHFAPSLSAKGNAKGKGKGKGGAKGGKGASAASSGKGAKKGW
jgi:hypothetical protein